MFGGKRYEKFYKKILLLKYSNCNMYYNIYYTSYNHHKIFSRCVSIGLILLTLDICLWLIKVPNTYIVLIFLLGLEETLMAAYYIYKLCIYNFE